MKFGQWLGFIVFLVSLYVLWQIRQLLLLIFTSIVLVVALNRIVKRIERFGIRKKIAILLTLFLCVVTAIIFFSLIVPPFIEQFQKLIELTPKAWEQISNGLTILRQQRTKLEWLPPIPPLGDIIQQQLQPLGSQVFSNFIAIFSNSFTIAFQFIFVIILTIMFLLNPTKYRQSLIQLFPSFYRRRADEIMTLSEEALGGWLIGIVISSTFVGLLSGTGLFFLQINLVLVHAIMAGLLNFIPNIGPTMSLVFPLMIALIDSPIKIVPIIILYFFIQNIESYLLTPTVMAKQVSLLPAITLMAQIFFAQMFGILGLLLALPLTVVTKTWLDEVLFKDILDQWQLKPSFLAHQKHEDQSSI
ncbi:AI-2E family transporter [Aphanothece hegewaldii CCALA 016]|uniref:AI-2E family transporter n=1 Tax=Aphanothece hegewaldii CCALA 016 TaxID=2107694 RepID=A0A2T1LY20_9CHRO|nr:AI-2E family transporter [Aphanothece hegewaldii]PSF37290.1 AI-2E family transporter [Aphanothece hegewaldii CCALA 016]